MGLHAGAGCSRAGQRQPKSPPRLAGGDARHHAVRLGFRLVHGLNEDELQKLVAARGNGFSSIERLAAVAGVSRFTIERLAEADAFRSLELDRRAALWAARRLDAIGLKSAVLNLRRHPERPHAAREGTPEADREIPPKKTNRCRCSPRI